MSVIPLSTPESETAQQSQQGTQYVFFFGAGKAEGNGKMKEELGRQGRRVGGNDQCGSACASGLYDSDSGVP